MCTQLHNRAIGFFVSITVRNTFIRLPLLNDAPRFTSFPRSSPLQVHPISCVLAFHIYLLPTNNHHLMGSDCWGEGIGRFLVHQQQRRSLNLVISRAKIASSVNTAQSVKVRPKAPPHHHHDQHQQ